MDNKDSVVSPVIPSPLQAAGTLPIIVAGVALWFLIGATLLSPSSLFAGFLLAWGWSSLEQMDVKRLPHATGGAVMGLALSWLLKYASQSYGSTGTLFAVVILLVVVYLLIRGRFELIINSTMALFLTVGTIPLLQEKVDFAELIIATLLGAIVFGAYVAGLKWIAGRLTKTAS